MKNKLPNPKETKRKFYNKYIYKVSLDIEGISYLRYIGNQSISDAFNDFANGTYSGWGHRGLEKLSHNKDVVYKLVPLLESTKDIRTRFEGSILDVYTNDLDLYDALCDNFPEYIWRRYKPKKGMEDTILDSKNQIFVKHFPHNKYRYKVFLHPHKLPSDRQGIVDWFAKQTERTSISPSIVNWMKDTNVNWDRRYILVEDEATLLMLRLRCSELIGPVHEYVVK